MTLPDLKRRAVNTGASRTCVQYTGSNEGQCITLVFLSIVSCIGTPSVSIWPGSSIMAS